MDYQQLFSAPIDVGSRLLAAMQQQQMSPQQQMMSEQNVQNAQQMLKQG